MLEKKRDVAREICRSYGVTLSPETLEKFAEMLVPRKLLRGAHALKEGEVCNHMFYVERGLVLQYYHKQKLTVAEYIAHEGDMVICIESFFQREPSKISIVMLEPGILYGIPHDELFEWAKTSFEICEMIFAIEQRSLIISQQKADVIRFESAKERYLRTLRENPDIVRRAPLHYVASYLQMTPETLSRVRASTTEDDI